jgi:DNA-binding NarL/FixJ family response regulator
MSQPLRRPIRLFVAESSPISSQLLAEALARDSGIDVLGFSSSPAEIGRIVVASYVEVLLVSARLEEDTNRGLSLLQQLRTERPALKAIVLLDSSKPDVVVGAFRSGAAGVFCRDTAIRILRKCIAAVHSGQIWANSEELGFVLSALAKNPPFQLDKKRLIPLSAREKEVVRCLIEGLTNREIGQTLTLSQHTVKNYIFNIFDKLGVSNRVELVLQVLARPAEDLWIDSFPPKMPATPISRGTPPLTRQDRQSRDTAAANQPLVLQPRSREDAENGAGKAVAIESGR